MKILFLSVKAASVLLIVYLVFEGVDLWNSKDLSSRMQENSVVSAPKQLTPLKIERNVLSMQEVKFIASKNLFRPLRAEYIPVPLKSTPAIARRVEEEGKPVTKKYIPPPRISLEGVVVIPGRNIAFLEGQYPRLRDDSALEYISLKSRQFEVGDWIGQFKITEIMRDRVILNNLEGDTMKLKLNDME
jgi:hypothetical protein